MKINDIYLKIEEIEINPLTFKEFTITEETFFIPTFELKILQKDYSLLEKLKPFYELNITFGKNLNLKKYKFIVLDYNYSSFKKEGLELTISGLLKLNDFMFNPYQNAKECNLSEFIKNFKYYDIYYIDDSNDKMKWLQPNITEKQFFEISIPFIGYDSFPVQAYTLDGIIVKDYSKHINNYDYKFSPTKKDDTYYYDYFEINFDNSFILNDNLKLPILDIKSQKYSNYYINYKNNSFLEKNRNLRSIVNMRNVYDKYYKNYVKNIAGWNELYRNNITIAYSNYYLNDIRLLDIVQLFTTDNKYQNFSKKNYIITRKELYFSNEGYKTTLRLNRNSFEQG